MHHNKGDMGIKELNNFWKWVSVNINNLNPSNINDEYIGALDDKIKELGDFSWEIGYDNIKSKNFLAISSEGDIDLLEDSKSILNESPIIAGWVFYSARPPKQWNLVFELIINDKPVSFNAKEWQYVLYRSDNNVYDIVVKVPTAYKPYEEYFDNIGFIATEGELGEAFVLEYINVIDLVYEFNEREQGMAKDFIYLKTEILL